MTDASGATGRLVQRKGIEMPAQRNGTDGATKGMAGATEMGGLVQQSGMDSQHKEMGQLVQQGASGRLVQQKGIEMPAQRNGTDSATKWDSWCN